MKFLEKIYSTYFAFFLQRIEGDSFTAHVNSILLLSMSLSMNLSTVIIFLDVSLPLWSLLIFTLIFIVLILPFSNLKKEAFKNSFKVSVFILIYPVLSILVWGFSLSIK